MSDTSIAAGATGNSGALASDELFEIKEGRVELSTDGGTTYMERGPREPIVFSSGQTVHWRNTRPIEAVLHRKTI